MKNEKFSVFPKWDVGQGVFKGLKKAIFPIWFFSKNFREVNFGPNHILIGFLFTNSILLNKMALSVFWFETYFPKSPQKTRSESIRLQVDPGASLNRLKMLNTISGMNCIFGVFFRNYVSNRKTDNAILFRSFELVNKKPIRMWFGPK